METLRFLHIPKTAGSTFTSILQRKYFGKKIFSLTGLPLDDQARYQARSQSYINKIRLFIGHAPIETGIAKADSARIITFLREPVSRVKSFCQHVAEGKSEYLVKEFPPDNFDLDKFLDSDNTELSNLQTKFLVGQGSIGSFYSLSEHQAVALALSNLFNKIEHFGLQEYFDESLIVFSSAFNWSLPTYVSKNTAQTGKKLHFEERHLQKIRELNRLDLAVYQEAKLHFENLINSPEFDRQKLHRLKWVNKYCRSIIFVQSKGIELFLHHAARWVNTPIARFLQRPRNS